ncbi:hypothetical protein LEP1GSC188_2581 [Leptospira weilii serovar Topaz str. LT2116]|uniref:Uncharacterized protein n=1 Tax=Leptospira weilii serovar Topaz str. LT2116 TaxID=1088540 RepID=M3GT77_9LEPT|nr:hypothetical protein LEP1GSC188_2581 [Leptospira weilii serovar Topaz str. LT2116]
MVDHAHAIPLPQGMEEPPWILPFLGAVEVPEAAALPEAGKINSNIMINKYIIERSNFQSVWIHWLESVLSLFSFVTDKSESYRFKKYFSREDLQRIESTVSNSETRHQGEIKIILESSLPVSRV